MTRKPAHTPFLRAIRPVALALLVSVSSMATRDARAIIYDVGVADGLAVDQPRVAWGLTNEDTATLIGPLQEGYFAVVDTLASGILIGQIGYLDPDDLINPIDYGQPLYAADYDGNGTVDADEQYAQYAEQGVAGFSLLNVHDEHGLRIQDSAGVQRLIGYDPVAEAAGDPDYYKKIRAFGDDGLSLGSFNAVVGMPAMIGYAIQVDMTPSLDFELHNVYWHDSLADAVSNGVASMNVNLRMVPSVHTDTTLPEDLRPTFAKLPVIDGINFRHTGGANSPGGQQSTIGTLGLDFGAQTTIFSENLATQLGIDFMNEVASGGDVVEYIEVGGIGGTVFMPIVALDELLVPTDDGNYIMWRDIAIGVLDIEGAPFEGVLGMNMLTTGYFPEVFLGETDAHVFNGLVVDFTSAEATDAGILRLDFAQTPVPVPEPSSLLLITIAGAAVMSRGRR